jgi:hypothetical protein
MLIGIALDYQNRFGMMEYVNIKQISLVAMMAALTVAIYALLSPLYLVFFIIAILSLKPFEAYIFAIVLGLLTYLVSGRIETVTNLVWLPFIVLILKQFESFIYGGKLADGCLSNPSTHHHGRLALITLFAILVANLGSEIIAMLVQELGVEYLLASSPIWIGGAVVNALIIGLTGIQSQRRLSKIFHKLH